MASPTGSGSGSNAQKQQKQQLHSSTLNSLQALALADISPNENGSGEQPAAKIHQPRFVVNHPLTRPLTTPVGFNAHNAVGSGTNTGEDISSFSSRFALS